MARTTAKFACAVLAGLIGTAVLTARVPAAAADECLTEPAGGKADGQSWHYRLERGSNRRCWYLRDAASGAKENAGDAAPRQANQAPSAWDFAGSAPLKLTTRHANGPAPHAGTEALADDDASSAAKPPGDAAAPSWQPLESADMDASVPVPFASPAPDSAAPATDPAAAPGIPVATPAKPAKPAAPIEKLLMVVIGALSLSGLLASAVYRLGKAGRHRRRDRNWQRAAVRARRNREKPRARSKAAPVPAAKPAVALEPKPEVAATPAPVDPAAELVDLLGSHAAKRAAQPPVHEIADPAAELTDLLESRFTPPAPAAKPVAIPTQPTPSVETAAPQAIDPIAELTHLLEAKENERAARPDSADAFRRGSPPPVDLSKAQSPKIGTPGSGKRARRAADGPAPRRKDAARPPVPPALMLQVENDGPTPPLDFIPRPQVLRPRVRDISQDESLDGVQDILARLAKHG